MRVRWRVARIGDCEVFSCAGSTVVCGRETVRVNLNAAREINKPNILP